ncbi:MAG: S1 RNA-binding domain-containing protein [Oscillospiraceae bacterium]|nr:S1 RNA-binding domain-containing protein [Oscillospiraceae bacterium]
MELKVGAVLEGTIKTITNFGAFVGLPENRTGMVHISEVANSYVSDIREHLQEGQSVKVRVIKIDDMGKIALSIKKAEEPPVKKEPRPGASRDVGDFGRPKAVPAPQSFEEKLKQFMSDSDSKISGCGRYERRSKTRKR